ncbi:MAG: hypothetical protein J6Y60_05345 [Treponema sp.]|nr:hypothetical protein [Treponema sp.]
MQECEKCYTKWYYPNQIDFIIDTYGKCEYTDMKRAPKPRAGEPIRCAVPVTSYRYLNTAVSFDTESSSFIYNKERYSTMYAWGVDIFGCSVIGRTWAEFKYLIERLVSRLGLNLCNRLVIYVHNLSYDFALFRKWFNWNEVFSVKSRSVLFAVTSQGVEFRCSYKMSGMSLHNLAEQMDETGKDKLEKLDEQYDYSLIRHSETPMTPDEIEYLVHDIKIVTRYINRQLANSSIEKLPYTVTGIVRRYCRDHCIGNLASKEVAHCYRKHIHSMNMTVSEYFQANRAFQGGFTHSNPIYTGVTLHNVASYDITSSYPTVMISEKFPMSSGVLVDYMNEETFRKNLARDDVVMTYVMTIKNVKPKFQNDFYISYSKCTKAENEMCSNGRIVFADSLTLTATSADFEIIEQCYDFDIDIIFNVYMYKAGYLPKQIIEAILYFYKGKTELKDVEGQEELYMLLKGMLNSVYGMSVEDVVRDWFEYDYDNNKWKDVVHKESMEDDILQTLVNNANTDPQRFLFYLWGCFCTAFARRNIWKAILECGDDYIYCDTDSVKFLNHDNHIEFFEQYNADVQTKIQKCLAHYKLDADSAKPKNKDGNEKPLGVFDYEGTYIRFKTLGAKRYLVEYYDKKKDKIMLKLTCAGVSKKKGTEYFSSMKDPFSEFFIGMKIDPDHTGKQTLSYIDDEYEMTITDHEGFSYHIHEMSGVYMENTGFDTDKKGGKEFLEFIAYYQQERFVL